MELLIGLIVVVVLYFYFSSKGKSKSTAKGSSKKQSSGEYDEIKQSFLPPIPAGYQIYAGCPVAGMQHRKEEAIKFAQSRNQELTLERDTRNEFDPNAIKIIGKSGATQYFIGFLPKEISAQIVGTGLFESIQARLGRIYLSSTGFLDIQYQIIGPKKQKQVFDDFLRNQPADALQKEYLKFFGLAIPKSLTTGQAEKIIVDHGKTSKPEELEEWNGLRNILEEFDDKDFREGYSLKKVSKTILMDALNKLRAEGKNYKYLSDNIDEVAEKIIELKPDLETE